MLTSVDHEVQLNLSTSTKVVRVTSVTQQKTYQVNQTSESEFNFSESEPYQGSDSEMFSSQPKYEDLQRPTASHGRRAKAPCNTPNQSIVLGEDGRRYSLVSNGSHTMFNINCPVDNQQYNINILQDNSDKQSNSESSGYGDSDMMMGNSSSQSGSPYGSLSPSRNGSCSSASGGGNDEAMAALKSAAALAIRNARAQRRF